MFTLLCSSHHHPFPQFFTFLNWNSVPLNTKPPSHFFLWSQPLASTSVLSDTKNFTLLCTSYKGNQTIFVCTYCVLECIFKVNLIYVLLIVPSSCPLPTVLYSRFSVIYFIYSSVYMSISSSQFIPLCQGLTLITHYNFNYTKTLCPNTVPLGLQHLNLQGTHTASILIIKEFSKATLKVCFTYSSKIILFHAFLIFNISYFSV